LKAKFSSGKQRHDWGNLEEGGIAVMGRNRGKLGGEMPHFQKLIHPTKGEQEKNSLIKWEQRILSL